MTIEKIEDKLVIAIRALAQVAAMMERGNDIQDSSYRICYFCVYVLPKFCV